MFKENKYSRCYYSIVSRARSRILEGYTETHHVIPTSLGGTDDQSNLVKLTAREHYICHLLLPKMTSGSHHHKMLYAYIIMSGRKLYNSKKYSFYRTEYASVNSKLRSGASNGMFGADRAGEKNTFFGKKHSEETKRKISEKKKGVSISLPPMTKEHKQKISANQRARAKSFTLTHKVHGMFYGSLLLLSETYPEQKLRKDELWKLTAGLYKSYKGWKVVN